MTEVAHYTTKKAGGDTKGRKKQATKPQRAETRPAPHGQRITPVLDPAFVKKVNEEILKRSRVCLKLLIFNSVKNIFSRKKKRLLIKEQLLNILLKKVFHQKKSLN
jgi:hypothetical protein